MDYLEELRIEEILEDMLDLLKELLGIDFMDISKNTILKFYLNKAKISIKKYCVLTEEEYNVANLNNQTVELAMYYYNNKKQVGVKSYSEGKRSVTYSTNSIPYEIKDLLPKPSIVFM